MGNLNTRVIEDETHVDEKTEEWNFYEQIRKRNSNVLKLFS